MNLRGDLVTFVVLMLVVAACQTGATSVSTTALNASTSMESDAHSPTSAVDSTETSVPAAAGWTFVEIPFSVREGSAYAAGDGWFLVWGGAPDRSGDLKADGLLVDVDTGEWLEVPEAPIEGRYSSTAVWTGAEFVVFGGHSFDESFVDGAAFDPVSETWRLIPEAPLSPAAHPASVWTGSEMVVWLAGNDSEFARLPLMSLSQMAAYDPVADSWRIMDAPQVQLVDATLLNTGNGLILVGGPATRDLGTVGPVASVKTTSWDPNTGSWDQPAEGPTAESVRPFALADGSVGVITDDGSVHIFDDSGWSLATQVSEDCWFDIGASSQGDSVFLKSCGTYQLEDGDATLILEQDAYGATTNLYGSGFLTTVKGQLITLTDLDSGDGTTGTAVFGVFDSSK